MKRILQIISVFLFIIQLGFIAPALASKTFSYYAYSGAIDSDLSNIKPLSEFSILIGDIQNEQREVIYREQKDEDVKEEIHHVTSDWQTIGWQVNDDISKKKYQGRRIANQIEIKGELDGRDIDYLLDIDQDPFYFNPKIGLQFFAQSGQDEMTFWGIRHDKLTVHKMRAINKGIESIKVNDEFVEAYHIYWKPAAGFARYFSRVYWFRVSDGMYVKQKSFGRKFKVLVSED